MEKQIELLTVRDQHTTCDGILKDRLQNLLPQLMQESGVQLWMVFCREYNEDPVFKTLVPSLIKNAARTSCLAFALENGQMRAINLGRPDPRLAPFYENAYNPREEDQWEVIGRVARQYGGTIHVNRSAGCAMADGLSASLRDEIAAKLPDIQLASAEELVVRWLSTRTQTELDWYPRIHEVAMTVLREAFSKEVITPGVTTTTDVEYYVMQRINRLGLDSWFAPDVDLQRVGGDNPRMNHALILPGDLLHIDMGITYLNLYTDTQRLAYVLKPGESAAPAGILAGVERCTRFQDIVRSHFAPGRTGNQVLLASLEQGKQEGLRPMLYTHPVGVFGHAAGPTIGMFDNQNSVPHSGENRLYGQTCFALELNVIEPVPEWDNQEVWFMLEETICFTGEDTHFMDDERGLVYLI